MTDILTISPVQWQEIAEFYKDKLSELHRPSNTFNITPVHFFLALDILHAPPGTEIGDASMLYPHYSSDIWTMMGIRWLTGRNDKGFLHLEIYQIFDGNEVWWLSWDESVAESSWVWKNTVKQVLDIDYIYFRQWAEYWLHCYRMGVNPLKVPLERKQEPILEYLLNFQNAVYATQKFSKVKKIFLR